MCDLWVFTHCTRPNSRTVHVDIGLLYTYSLVVCGIGFLFNSIQELFPEGLPKNYSVGNTVYSRAVNSSSLIIGDYYTSVHMFPI